jgi:hypothetical protein
MLAAQKDNMRAVPGTDDAIVQVHLFGVRRALNSNDRAELTIAAISGGIQLNA